MAPVKHILVPVDYSACSLQAARYAFHLASETGARIHVLHVFNIPVVAADSYVYVPDPDELEGMRKNNLDRMAGLMNDVPVDRFPQQSYELHCKYGTAPEQILEFIHEHAVELVVMGLQGKGQLLERMAGSTTTLMFKKSPAPVLAIHPETTWSPVRNILLAYDMKPFANVALFAPLVKLARSFNAQIHVLNVTREMTEFPMPAQKLLDNHMDPALPADRTSYHVIEHQDIVEGIRNFTEQHEMDWIVMVSRKHHLLDHLFGERSSKKAAYHLDQPLFALHD